MTSRAKPNAVTAATMSSQPLVSVITPSYNQGEFVEATLRSVVEQDYPHVEYIVCDGGSTDASAEIIAQYARDYPDRIRWWCSEKDSGQPQAINKGLARATGEVVAWINSDDCYLPGAISAAVRQLGSRPELGLVYGELELIDERGRCVGDFRTREYTFADQLTQRLTIPQPSSFWRSSVVRDVGGVREDLHYAFDFEYWIRIGRRYRIARIPERLAQFRISRVNKGGVGGANWGPEFVCILDALYTGNPDAPDIATLRRAAYAGAYLRGATWYLAAGDTGTARAWVRRAVATHPGVLREAEWWTSAARSLLDRRLYALARAAKHAIQRAPT